MKKCRMCEKEKELTIHHLIPKCLHGKKFYQKNFDRHFLSTHTIEVCNDCHKEIHKFFTEKELAKHYSTTESLLSNMKIKNYIDWAKKQD